VKPDTERYVPPEDTELADLLGAMREDLADGDDAAVRRVDARLRRPARPVRRGLPIWATAVAMAATAVVTIAILRQPPPPADDTPFTEIGDEIVAGADGAVASLPGDAATLGLMPGGRLARLADDARGAPVFDLHEGTVTVDVTPGQLPGFHVEAADVKVSVLGTSFVVSRHGAEVTVAVLRGVVQVTHAGLVRRLAAGETFRSGPDAPALEEATPEPPHEAQDVAPAIMATPPETPASPDFALTPAEQEFLDIQDALAQGAEAEALIEATTGYLARHPASQFAIEVEALQVEATARAARHRDAYDLAAAFCAAHPDSPRRLQILQIQATVARDRLHDCSLALGPYRELADALGSSAQGTDATYYRAVCALSQGLEDEATAGFQRYLELAPDGEHAVHARATLDSMRVGVSPVQTPETPQQP